MSAPPSIPISKASTTKIAILVQAEIVIGDDDDVDRQDTDTLVNEVIAFIGSPDDDDDQP